MKNAKLLLEQLTELMPPSEGQRHNITVENGSMVVCLMLGEKYLPLALDDNDLDKSPLELINDIMQITKNVGTV